MLGWVCETNLGSNSLTPWVSFSVCLLPDTARVQCGERSEKTYRHGEAMGACVDGAMYKMEHLFER